MDAFMIKDGKVENIIVVETIALAEQLFPDHTFVERDDTNKHINPGDDWVPA